MSQSKGKLSGKDATTARLLKIAPWIALLAASIPAPLVSLSFFLQPQPQNRLRFIYCWPASPDPWVRVGGGNRRHSPVLPHEDGSQNYETG